jgi:GDP-4-dehydro-6-deoxy-D-mannose reductase
MARVLVTGATGFVGRRLVARLVERGDDEVHGLSRQPPQEGAKGWTHHAADLASERVRDIVRDVLPDLIYHLGALAHPGDCERGPKLAATVNGFGTGFLLSALEGTTARVLLSSTAAVYGSQPEGRVPEDAVAAATAAYGRSKLIAEAFARRDWDWLKRNRAIELLLFPDSEPESKPDRRTAVERRRRYKAYVRRALPLSPDRTFGFRQLHAEPRTVIARAFNHAGAGQEPRYVLAAFASEILRAQREGGPVRHGNLWPVRDFLHVDDVLDAYELLASDGEPGEVYNVCRGEGVAVGDLLRGLLDRLAPGLPTELDPELARPGEAAEVVGDPSRLRALGWAPRRTLEDLLDEVAAAVQG